MDHVETGAICVLEHLEVTFVPEANGKISSPVSGKSELPNSELPKIPLSIVVAKSSRT